MFDPERFISDRARAVDASGIRKVFDLAAKLRDPINLSIGQPDFDVPSPVKQAAVEAIQKGFNRYTVTQGIPQLCDKVRAVVGEELPGWVGPDGRGEDFGVLVTSGVSGGLMLAVMACVGPGDEVLVPDPYFVMYKHLVALTGAKAVYVDTYPDFQLTAGRIERCVTPRTKMLLFSTPSNPTGVAATDAACRQIVELAQRHRFLVLSDEIYDRFYYGQTTGHRAGRCPTPATHSRDLLLLRGFSKTYAMTGWRLGYAVGPRAVIEQMAKLQQYSFVCAPSMVQAAGVVAMDQDVTSHVEAYRRRRDRVVQRLAGAYELTVPDGAFYAFPKVPDRLGVTGSEFARRAVDRNLLLIPGGVFSNRDTHFRISYACDEKTLDRGLDVLLEMALE